MSGSGHRRPEHRPHDGKPRDPRTDAFEAEFREAGDSDHDEGSGSSDPPDLRERPPEAGVVFEDRIRDDGVEGGVGKARHVVRVGAQHLESAVGERSVEVHADPAPCGPERRQAEQAVIGRDRTHLQHVAPRTPRAADPVELGEHLGMHRTLSRHDS